MPRELRRKGKRVFYGEARRYEQAHGLKEDDTQKIDRALNETSSSTQRSDAKRKKAPAQSQQPVILRWLKRVNHGPELRRGERLCADGNTSWIEPTGTRRREGSANLE